MAGRIWKSWVSGTVRVGRYAVVVLIGGALLAGCGTAPGGAASSPTVGALRTDPDHRGLVASYIGGSCDGPARLAVQESAERIELSIVVDPDPAGARACDAVGHGRTVRARLSGVVGRRSVWEGRVRHLPFDGAHLLVPAYLPKNFAAAQEQGSTRPAVVAASAAAASSAGSAASAAASSGGPTEPGPTVETVDWTTSYSEPGLVDGDRCRPGRGTLEVEVGTDAGVITGDGWSMGSTVDIGGHVARWWRQGGDRIALAWSERDGAGDKGAGEKSTGADGTSRDGDQVAVISEAGCQGDRLLTTAEIERVALSLRPA